MNRVKNTGDQSVLQADQRADGQKRFNPRRAAKCGMITRFQLGHKQGELDTDQNDRYQESVLDDFANQLNVQAGM